MGFGVVVTHLCGMLITFLRRSLMYSIFSLIVISKSSIHLKKSTNEKFMFCFRLLRKMLILWRTLTSINFLRFSLTLLSILSLLYSFFSALKIDLWCADESRIFFSWKDHSRIEQIDQEMIKNIFRFLFGSNRDLLFWNWADSYTKRWCFPLM